MRNLVLTIVLAMTCASGVNAAQVDYFNNVHGVHAAGPERGAPIVNAHGAGGGGGAGKIAPQCKAGQVRCASACIPKGKACPKI